MAYTGRSYDEKINKEPKPFLQDSDLQTVKAVDSIKNEDSHISTIITQDILLQSNDTTEPLINLNDFCDMKNILNNMTYETDAELLINKLMIDGINTENDSKPEDVTENYVTGNENFDEIAKELKPDLDEILVLCKLDAVLTNDNDNNQTRDSKCFINIDMPGTSHKLEDLSLDYVHNLNVEKTIANKINKKTEYTSDFQKQFENFVFNVEITIPSIDTNVDLSLINEIIEINDTDSYCSGYQSSDFEFITKAEALEFSIATRNYKSAEIPKQHSETQQNRENHVIPDGDNFLKLFQDIQYLPVYNSLDNKCFQPTPPMDVEHEGLGFDMMMFKHADNDIDEEFIREAQESRNKIMDIYPMENRKRPRRF